MKQNLHLNWLRFENVHIKQEYQQMRVKLSLILF